MSRSPPFSARRLRQVMADHPGVFGGIGIVVVAPALRCQQDHGPQKGRQVVHDVSLATIVLHPLGHPGHNTGRVEDFP